MERTAGTDRYRSIVEVYVPPSRFMIIYKIQRMDHGCHVIVEGILYSDRYGDMLTALMRDHVGLTRRYYLHVSFEQTLARHATKAEALKCGETEMRAWYRELDLLPGGFEQVIPATSSLQDTTARIMADAGLASSLPAVVDNAITPAERPSVADSEAGWRLG
jgi:hypothetical protein